MHALEDVKIRARNYKCFGDDLTGFTEIRPVNLIVGRNNSGKSALVDLIAIAVGGSAPGVDASRNPQNTPVFGDMGHNGAEPELVITQKLTEDALRVVYPEKYHDDELKWDNDVWAVVHNYIGKDAEWRLGNAGDPSKSVELIAPKDLAKRTGRKDYGVDLANTLRYRLLKYSFFRLASDRDIVTENDAVSQFMLSNGEGATKLIREFLHREGYDRSLIQETLLSDLNAIFQPDCSFTEIAAKQLRNNDWEINLSELGKKGQVRLSRSGSGLKTVILVLANLHLMPYLLVMNRTVSLDGCVFAFEELENNLHPALQRRLFTYLRDFAVKEGCTLFLTTHSNIVLDLFSNDPNVQIVHVEHDGEKASVTPVSDHLAKCGVLDDLGHWASDMLQANCLVWVEGPSDRTYLKHWIGVWTDGELKEGTHYRVMPYGGDMVDYFTGDDPDANPDDLIAMVGFNRHTIFVCDRDKTEKESQKARIDKIKRDVEDRRGVAWITDGKEIENYIPSKALKRLWGKTELPPLGQDEDFEEYVKTHAKKGMGPKPRFARRVCKEITREMLEKDEHLSKWLTKICGKIREWNGMPVVAEDANG